MTDEKRVVVLRYSNTGGAHFLMRLAVRLKRRAGPVHLAPRSPRVESRVPLGHN